MKLAWSSLAGFLLLVCISVCTSVLAQTPAELRGSVGIGTFSMRDMKELQESTLSFLGVNSKPAVQYPAALHYNLKYFFKSPIEDHYGIVLEMGTAVGRTAYADNSGYFREDQRLQYRRIGVVVESYQPLPAGFTCWVGVDLSILYSKMTYDGELYVYGVGAARESYTLSSWGGAFQPYISLERKIGGISIGTQLGGSLSISEAFHLKNERDVKLVNSQKDNEEVAPGWSGLRLSLYIGIPLSAKETFSGAEEDITW